MSSPVGMIVGEMWTTSRVDDLERVTGWMLAGAAIGFLLGVLIGVVLWRIVVARRLRRLSQVIQNAPQKPEHYVDRGLYWQHNVGYVQKAIEDFTSAIELCSDDWSTYGLRAIAHVQLGDYHLAIRDSTDAVDRITETDNEFIDRWEVFYARSQAYYELGYYAEAIADATTALELELAEEKGDIADEPLAMLYYRRAMSYRHLSDRQRAKEDFKCAHRLDRKWHLDPRRSVLIGRWVLLLLGALIAVYVGFRLPVWLELAPNQ